MKKLILSLLIAFTSTAAFAQQSESAELQKVREEMQAAGVATPRNLIKLNDEGYRALYEENDIPKALKFFRWNLALFPKSAADLTDSLAEGYLQAGDREQAIAYYTKALEISPNIQSNRLGAKATLDRLKADPKNLPILQKEYRDDYKSSHAK